MQHAFLVKKIIQKNIIQKKVFTYTIFFETLQETNNFFFYAVYYYTAYQPASLCVYLSVYHTWLTIFWQVQNVTPHRMNEDIFFMQITVPVRSSGWVFTSVTLTTMWVIKLWFVEKYHGPGIRGLRYQSKVLLHCCQCCVCPNLTTRINTLFLKKILYIYQISLTIKYLAKMGDFILSYDCSALLNILMEIALYKWQFYYYYF